MKTMILTAALACLPTRASRALAQASPTPAPAAPTAAVGVATEAVQISEARKKNAALMRQYTWNSRVELMKAGGLVDMVISLDTPLPNGQIQRTVLNDEHAPLPGGFLRRAAAENKLQDAKQYAAGLKELLEQYTLPTAGKVLDFIMNAKTTGPDPAGSLILTGHNVVMGGDTLILWVGATNRQMRRAQVSTRFQGDPVNVTATYTALPSGLNYMEYAEGIIPSKQLNLLIQNYNFTPAAY